MARSHGFGKYFIPNDQAIDILLAARQRGVDVKIMVSGVHNDNAIVLSESLIAAASGYRYLTNISLLPRSL